MELDNHNIPTAHLPIRAFNLVIGAAFMVPYAPDPRVWIVERVVRDEHFERVFLWAHDGTNHPDLAREMAFDLDFCDQVALVGLSVNPSDPDDNDWGGE